MKKKDVCDTEKAMLHEVLGIENGMEITVPNRERTEIEPIQEDPLSEDAQNDYNTSRSTLKGLIEVGNKAVVDLADLAEAGQYPRAYEVLATLIKTVGETTNSLYDIQKNSKVIQTARRFSTQEKESISTKQFLSEPLLIFYEKSRVISSGKKRRLQWKSKT